MRGNVRWVILGVGAALLIGGWGTTRYADKQVQRAAAIKEIGVMLMVLGAGVIGFAVMPVRRSLPDTRKPSAV